MCWLKEHEFTVGANAGMIAVFVAVLRLFIVGQMNQRFDELRAYSDHYVNE